MKEPTARKFYEQFHSDLDFPWISRRMQEERLRVIRNLLLKFGQGTPEGKWLLVGCGSGDDMSIAPGAVGIDLSRQSLRNTRSVFPAAKVAQADAQMLPFRDASFQLVICSEVVEHIPDRESFFREAHRVLSPAGVLLLTTPNWVSWYGLARTLAEKVMNRPVTAAGQPIDNWSTPASLAAEISPLFNLRRKLGVWYYPPMGKGKYVLPFPLSAAIYWAFLPFERLFQGRLPDFGHMIALAAEKSSRP